KSFSFAITDAASDTGALPVVETAPVDTPTIASIPVAGDDEPVAAPEERELRTTIEQQQHTSNIALFLSGLGNGLLSVITPCVFAMLPMTVSFFLKRSKDRKTGVKIALQYSLSIVFIFT